MIDKYLFYFDYDLLGSLTVVVTILPLFLIIYRKAYIDPSFRLLLWLLVIKFGIDLIMFHLAATRSNNLVFFNLSILFRYAFLSGMFYYKFENKYLRKIIPPVTICFVVFFLWDIWNCNDKPIDLHTHRIVKYSLTLESALMIFWVLLYFYELIRSLKIPNLLTFPFFWVCSGLLLYYSSIIFIAPALHYVSQWQKQMDIGMLEKIPYVFEIVGTLLYSIGIWVFSARYYARQ